MRSQNLCVATQLRCRDDGSDFCREWNTRRVSATEVASLVTTAEILPPERDTIAHQQELIRRPCTTLESKKTSHANVFRQRVELELAAKDVREKTRRENDRLALERKCLEVVKSKLKKKRSIAETAKQVGTYPPMLAGYVAGILRGHLR